MKRPGKETLRPLKAAEVDDAYGVLLAAGEWLASKGIHNQWPVPFPRPLYDKRQQRQENYGCFVGRQLAVVLSITREHVHAWSHQTGDGESWWLASVAVAPAFHGQGIGRRAVQRALDVAHGAGAGTVRLGCISGFMPKYYESLGFQQVDRKTLNYPFGSFDMVLMAHDLSR